MRILRKGSTGAAVVQLQRELSKAGYTLKPDGDFGTLTDGAVRRFQEASGLVVDGDVGTFTWAALRMVNTPAKTPTRPEPDKGAMAGECPAGDDEPAAIKTLSVQPPNFESVRLLPTVRRIDELIVHCAATPEGKHFTVEDIRRWHKARGWSDIGYHYVVYLDGRVMLGRPIGQIGAHVAGHNTGTVGVCYVGGVSADGSVAKDTRTAAQRASLLWLTENLVRIHRITKITGHNEYAAKACPSFQVQRDPLHLLAA